jgi:FKBP-type peptidyl-prolyl cis-trans isomerase SlyD
MQIAKDTVVSLDVRLSDVHGNLIQQSAEAVQYLHGDYGGIFPLVEEALQGRQPGEAVEVHLEPEDAFGDYDAELVSLEQRGKFPPAGDQVVLDGNHPLAGVALKFACTVVAVRAATEGEIERGYADDDAAGPLITVVQ